MYIPHLSAERKSYKMERGLFHSVTGDTVVLSTQEEVRTGESPVVSDQSLPMHSAQAVREKGIHRK